MTRFALLFVLPLLAECNVHSKNPKDGDDKVTINADENGHVSFNLPIAEGQVKVPAGMMHNGNIDIDGVKLMPGSTVIGFNLDAGNGGADIDVSFTAPAPPDQVRSYYMDQFHKQGVEAALNGDAVSGKSNDGSPFTITVTPAANGSQGRIEIHDKD